MIIGLSNTIAMMVEVTCTYRMSVVEELADTQKSVHGRHGAVNCSTATFFSLNVSLV